MRRQFMEEIVQEALTKGVEMHIAGEFEMASQLYGSVLKLRPNHADANHNMGLLKADAGHDLDALPYLQTALEADTSISQFWLSYAKVLSKLNRVDEANRILSLAKESGADGAEFLELQRQLNEPALVNALHKSDVKDPSQETIKQLTDLYNQGQLQTVFDMAKELAKQYPDSFAIWNILGASAAQMDMPAEAKKLWKK